MYYRNNDKVFLLAIAFSLLAHVTAILKLPNLEFDKPLIPEALVVVIAPPPKPVPPPPKQEPAPEPSKPELKPKPTPQPVPVKPVAPPPATASEPVAPPPQVIAVAPKVEAPPPTFVAPTPPPEPPKPVVINPDNDAIRAQYIRSIGPELAKNKHYPKMAMMRGWTGVTKVEIQLDSNGKLLSSEVKESSGYDVLDKQALELVRKTTFPSPPDAIVGRSITIPINFDLKTE